MGDNYQGNDYRERTHYPIFLFSLFLVGMVVACNFPTVPVKQSKAVIPTPTVGPTQTSTSVPTATTTVTPISATETLTPTATGISTLIPATATSQFAPFCESGIARETLCQYPIARQSSVFCKDKSPYNLIILNDRATYQVLHDHIQCSEAGIIDGQRMITCTGPMAYYFELQVCDSACSALSIETGNLQCPWGYHYNNLQNCCTKETQEVIQGCVVLKLRTKSCVIDCDQFTTEATCTDYGYACRWNDTSNLCQLRK